MNSWRSSSRRGRKIRTHATSAVLYRHQHTRRALVEELRKLESFRCKTERDQAHQGVAELKYTCTGDKHTFSNADYRSRGSDVCQLKSVVLFLAGATQRREIRARKVSTLVNMFKVATTESDGGTDTLHTPLLQQQQHQQQQQQPSAKQKEEGAAGQSGINSSTETEPSEISTGSFQSGSVSQLPDGSEVSRPVLWVADTPRRQRALSVDVPSGAPLDTPRRLSAPEVVVTHVTLLDDDAAEGFGGHEGRGEARGEKEGQEERGDTDKSSGYANVTHGTSATRAGTVSREPTPSSTSTHNLPPSSPTPTADEAPTITTAAASHGRLSPTLMTVPPSRTPSPPRDGSRSTSRRASIFNATSRPVSRVSKLSSTSLAFRRRGGPSPAPTHQQESVVLTEISAPLEDARRS
ncbi:hypothetical protein SK128_013488 [Halocaridina rubra]|uniref:Uncharacterized protein n=1 Tax=Halocaridina rubra TaxID=373956 RepID=A0AAN8WV99_HALRR